MSRTATISSIAGDTVTSTASHAQTFGRWDPLVGNVYIRIWNTTRGTAAWIMNSPASNTLQFTNSAHLSGWAPGDILQIGDPNPTGSNVLQMAAIDISPYLISQFGVTFRQKGVIANVRSEATAGPGFVSFSPDGSDGSAQSAMSLSTGKYNAVMLLV